MEEAMYCVFAKFSLELNVSISNGVGKVIFSFGPYCVGILA